MRTPPGPLSTDAGAGPLLMSIAIFAVAVGAGVLVALLVLPVEPLMDSEETVDRYFRPLVWASFFTAKAAIALAVTAGVSDALRSTRAWAAARASRESVLVRLRAE